MPSSAGQTASTFVNKSRLWAFIVAFAVFLFFACYIFYLLRLGETIPDLDITFSGPSRVVPGRSQDIVLHAFHKGTDQRASGLDLELAARTGAPVPKVLFSVPFHEIQPGLYLARYIMPMTTRYGEVSFSTVPTGKPGFPIAKFGMRSESRLALAAIPPTQRIRAGDPVFFQLALIEGETAHPVGGRPVRCRVFTPDGFEVVNRLRPITNNGIGAFRFRLHPFAPTGNWQVRFSVGETDICYELPVESAAPLAVRGIDSIKRWWNRVKHRFLPPILIPQPQINHDWHLMPRQEDYRSGPMRLISRPSKNEITVELTSDVSSRTTILEAWQGYRFLHGYEFAPRTGSASLRIPFQLAAARPIRWRMWQKDAESVTPVERVVPVLPHNQESADCFEPLANLSGDRSSGERILENLLMGPGGTIVHRTAIIKPHIIARHLANIANFVLIAFPIFFAIGLIALLWTLPRVISPETATFTTLKQYLAISLLLYGFYLLGFAVPREIGIPVSLLALSAFTLLGRFFTTHHNLSGYARLGSSFLMLGIYMAVLMLISQAYDRFGLVEGMIEPIGLLITLSVISVPAFFICIGILHLDQVPRKLADAGGTLVANLLAPFSSDTIAARALQIIIPVGLFYVFFVFLQQLSSTPDTERQSGKTSKYSSSSGGAVHPTTLVFKAFAHVTPAEASPESLFLLSGEIASPAASDSLITPMATTMNASSETTLFDTLRDTESPGRFFFVDGPFTWTGGRIETIRVFQTPREYLDRLAFFGHAFNNDFQTLAREFMIRAERFEHLSDQERKDETMTMEALMEPISHLLATPSDCIRNQVCQGIQLAAGSPDSSGMSTAAQLSRSTLISMIVTMLLNRAERIIGVDRNLLLSWRKLAIHETPNQAIMLQSGEPFLVHQRPETSDHHPNDMFQPLTSMNCFHGGGIIAIAGPGKNRIPIPVRGETLVLQRGLSFPQNFDIRRFDIRREAPLLLEIETERGW
ncbi:MAG: hypothetical protein HQM09_16835 [Candidatus Riflebacteria bacterium]|nr:hypothetical protein [Candidatus Riflebacteria bacterium]